MTLPAAVPVPNNLLPGTVVRCDFRKWDGSEHWQFMMRYLGLDEHGPWFGIPVGTHQHRPGAAFVSDYDAVQQFRDGFSPTFNDRVRERQALIYVDITTTPEWVPAVSDDTPPSIRMIDMDLDVVRRTDRLYIDDEDEFAEHRVQFGYPDDIAARCERITQEVFEAVQDENGVFDGSAGAWIATLRSANYPPMEAD